MFKHRLSFSFVFSLVLLFHKAASDLNIALIILILILNQILLKFQS